MKCPKCRAKQRCGCNSCYNRAGKQMLRKFKFVHGDWIKCAYCREKFHVEYWYDSNIHDATIDN